MPVIFVEHVFPFLAAPNDTYTSLPSFAPTSIDSIVVGYILVSLPKQSNIQPVTDSPFPVDPNDADRN